MAFQHNKNFTPRNSLKKKLIIISLLCGATLIAATSAYWMSGVRAPQWLKKISPHKVVATSFDWKASVSAFAGNGSAGHRNGLLPEANFSDPFGIVTDAQGNVYVSDAADNQVIRKISSDGKVSDFAGSHAGFTDGPGQQAAFRTPSGLAWDQNGNLYVADTGNHAIRKISPDGIVSTLAGNGEAGNQDGKGSQARFNGPIGVASDHLGNIYVADTYNDSIRKITPDGIVTTLAGGQRHGYQDGAAAAALFDTPCSLVVNSKQEVIVADTRNHAIRKISPDGMVSTLLRTDAKDDQALMHKPLALAITRDDYLYLSEGGNGRILQLSPDARLRGLTGKGIDFEAGDDTHLRFHEPTGIALRTDGSLLVADSSGYVIQQIQPGSPDSASRVASPASTMPAIVKPAKPFPWPLKPQFSAHEVVGTIGEVRGNYDGEAREHFHSGLDIQGKMGSLVYAIADETVRSPLATWSYGGLNEGMNIDRMSYIHMRVGRQEDNRILDSSRFQMLYDSDGKPEFIRVRRGSQFKTGEAIGSINRMFHVHLNYAIAGHVMNPLMLSFPGFRDEVPPVIEKITVRSQDGKALKQQAGGRLLIPHDNSQLSIIVDAYDQSDDNQSRRRLGLYKLAYQLLDASKQPLPGHEKVRYNIEFNRLPQDRESVKIAYAEGSGITVHGNAQTKFLYEVTNQVRDGVAKTAYWNPGQLPPGDYVIRIHALDYAGNAAQSGRDLAIRIQ